MPESNPQDTTTVTNPFVKKNDLNRYNTRVKTWVSTQLSTTITNIGTIFKLKGRVDTYESLPVDANPGDMYMVGTSESAECAEYFRTESGVWQYCGVTSPSLEGYITETQLYKGADGTGTIDNPATGTLLAAMNADIADVTADVEQIKTELNASISDTELDSMFAT